jgi:photoactive yellow protein
MDMIKFGASDLANVFAKLPPEKLDELSFGVVQVDAAGKIYIFNRLEVEITGSAGKAVIGKNFFTDIAVCTDETGFRGRFDEGVRSGNLNVLFEWALDGPRRDAVQVHLKAACEPDRYWIFTKRL